MQMNNAYPKYSPDPSGCIFFIILHPTMADIQTKASIITFPIFHLPVNPVESWLFVDYTTSICLSPTFVNSFVDFFNIFIDFPMPAIYNVNQKRGDGMNRRIKEIRSALGLTQQEFADRLSLKRNTIATYEMGKASPSDRTINDICEKYNVSETWLRTGKGEMFNELPEEDEVAAYVSELLEDDEGNPLYDIIKEIMHTYSELTPKSQEVIRDFSAQLLKNLKEKGD